MGPGSLPGQHFEGSSIGGSVIHVDEMIAEHLVSSPQIGGDGEEGKSTWCGRLLQGLGWLEQREQAEDKDVADFLPIEKCSFRTISPRWQGLAEM